MNKKYIKIIEWDGKGWIDTKRFEFKRNRLSQVYLYPFKILQEGVSKLLSGLGITLMGVIMVAFLCTIGWAIILNDYLCERKVYYKVVNTSKTKDQNE